MVDARPGSHPSPARPARHGATAGRSPRGLPSSARHGRRARPRACCGELGTISRQSVYNVLNVLTDKGIIRRIQPADSPARYEDRIGDNHHHLVCRSCGKHRRRLLRRRRSPLPQGPLAPRLQDRRSRSDLLGHLPRLPKEETFLTSFIVIRSSLLASLRISLSP